MITLLGDEQMSLKTEKKGGIIEQYRRGADRHRLAGSPDRAALGAHQRVWASTSPLTSAITLRAAGC